MRHEDVHSYIWGHRMHPLCELHIRHLFCVQRKLSTVPSIDVCACLWI